MKTLVIGATGTVGSNVTRGLVATGSKVRVLTRNKSRASHLPAGIEIALGDLNDPESARAAFAGIDTVFLLNGVTQTEANEGIVAVALATAAKVKRLVYMSVQGAHSAPHLPHFGSKIGVEAAVKASGIPYTILQPNNFFQNDAWLKAALLEYGVYAQPLGQKGLHRVDARDIADAAVNALVTDKFTSKSYVLAGPTLVNGPSTAEVWSSKLGKKIAYGGDDLDAWAQQASAMMPPWMVFDFKMMYAYFHSNGLIATPAELTACEAIVGHPLRTFDAFATEVAGSWK